ncbi:class I SAM-dependent methyltransferase [Ornithinimicrobium sp. Arc0846-15]|nr:class I SAM-dependent methyltransferase [Ornithinimicrobium laminariae]
MSGGWREIADDENVAGYDQRMAANLEDVAAAGLSVHAEADLVAEFAAPGATVLDGGCGTGRIAWRLAEMGYRVIGADNDPRMLAHAKAGDREVTIKPVWLETDLASVPNSSADVVLVAGNVMPLVGAEELPTSLAQLANLMSQDSVLISGFGLDLDHLPPGCEVLALADFDQMATDAGLELRARWGTWQGGPFAGDYVVNVHRLVRPAYRLVRPCTPTNGDCQ